MSVINKSLISICVPILDEEENIENLIDEVVKVTQKLTDQYEFEMIFTDNHSKDLSWEILKSLSENRFVRIKGVRFTKNIGFQESLFANLRFASGEAAILLDADLQDPPELIEKFLDEWKRGFKVVYGVRLSRQENSILTLLRKFGYRIIGKLAEFTIPIDVGDFRLIDKSVVKILLSTNVPRPYIRGSIASFGFKSIGVKYNRRQRSAGYSKFPFKNVLKLGIDGIINHSSWPLKFSAYSGLCILLLSFMTSIYYLYLRIVDDDLPQGLASIHILVLFGIGMNALFLGILGDYIRRIYFILRNDPRYVIEDSINIEGIK